MTTSNTQYQIQFTNVTVNGNKVASTIWMNTLEEVKSSKYINATDATVITREKPQTEMTFAEWKAIRN